jgi:gamma-glutamylcyclotransferase (GGCT)/AIG2-like uncharacterized protein YtfP
MPESKPCRHIAFYGSLMRESGTQEFLIVREELSFQGACEIPGELYDLGEFPGLIESCSSKVRGELYRFEEDRVLPVLDAYEGFDPRDPAGSLFVRRKVKLAQPDLDSWVYFYNRAVSPNQLIRGNCWVEHQQR